VVRYIAVGHRIGLVEDLGEDMKVAEARHIAVVVVVDNLAADNLVVDNLAVDSLVEDDSVEDNSAEDSFAEGSSVEYVAVDCSPAEGDMRVVEEPCTRTAAVVVEGSEGSSEGNFEGKVGHMEVATDLKFN